MIGLSVHLPAASWVVAGDRNFRNTYPVPPISTAYGFLLSMIGETNMSRHRGVRITTGALLWKDGKMPTHTLQYRQLRKFKSPDPTSTLNMKPDFQQVYGNFTAAIWLDSSGEPAGETLEDRVHAADRDPGSVSRFGALSLGESDWLVNDVRFLTEDVLKSRGAAVFRPTDSPTSHPVQLPVRADHKKVVHTTFVMGQLVIQNSHPPFDWLVPLS